MKVESTFSNSWSETISFALACVAMIVFLCSNDIDCVLDFSMLMLCCCLDIYLVFKHWTFEILFLDHKGFFLGSGSRAKDKFVRHYSFETCVDSTLVSNDTCSLMIALFIGSLDALFTLFDRFKSLLKGMLYFFISQ